MPMRHAEREDAAGGRTMTDLDLIDRKIVAELMQDATLPIAQIADKTGLSQTPAWKRIQKLEASGMITGRVALADPAKLGFGLTVFDGIEAPDHSPDWREAFGKAVDGIPEIMEAYRTAGELGSLLRVAVPDMAAFDGLYKRLTDAMPIKNVTSHFAMERMKVSTAYPVDTRSRWMRPLFRDPKRVGGYAALAAFAVAYLAALAFVLVTGLLGT